MEHNIYDTDMRRNVIVGFQLDGKKPSFGDAITCKKKLK